MKSITTILNNPQKRIQRLVTNRARRTSQWWTPVWRGLSADPESKHRIAMGPSVWLFLYLLCYANRRTGIARRRVDQIQKDTGYPVRSIQRHLKRLVQMNYITYYRSQHYLHISIKKWKSFHYTNELPFKTNR